MTIVLGYDGRASSQRALPVAIDLARDLGCALMLVCGVRPAGNLGEEFEQVESAILEVDAPAVADGLKQALAAGVDAYSILVNASPADAVMQIAADRRARMMVVGYGEAGRIRAAIGGAVALRILDEATIPLLVVP